MLRDIAFDIEEDAHGANGELTRAERVRRAAYSLIDYVYEDLLSDNIGYGTIVDANVYRKIERLVASAMIALTIIQKSQYPRPFLRKHQ
jgi:hypothetical protein